MTAELDTSLADALDLITKALIQSSLPPQFEAPLGDVEAAHEEAASEAIVREMDEPAPMSVPEIASILGVSNMTVYRLIHGGELAAVRIGRSLRVPAEEFQRFNGAGPPDASGRRNDSRKQVIEPQRRSSHGRQQTPALPENGWTDARKRPSRTATAKMGVDAHPPSDSAAVTVTERSAAGVQLRSIAQVAARLGVSRQTVYRFVQAGELPAVRLGRSLAVPADAMQKFLAERS